MMAGTMGMHLSPVAGEPGVLQFDVAYPEHLSRWKIFVKWLLVIPHLIVLALLGVVLMLTTIVAFFAILITGRYPYGLWTFALGVLRWTANITAYASDLQRDEYPPFSLDAGAYPGVRFEMEYPPRLSRGLVLIKWWLLLIPSAFVLYFLQIALSVVLFLAFFAILFTGFLHAWASA